MDGRTLAAIMISPIACGLLPGPWMPSAFDRTGAESAPLVSDFLPGIMYGAVLDVVDSSSSSPWPRSMDGHAELVSRRARRGRQTSAPLPRTRAFADRAALSATIHPGRDPA
jgi:hypothetical protein